MQKGILCGLTKKKPTFIDECDKFELNPEKDEFIDPSPKTDLTTNNIKKNWPSKVSGWIGAFIGMMCIPVKLATHSG